MTEQPGAQSDLSRSPAPPSSLLQETEQAFTLASQGALTAVDLINAAQKLVSANQAAIAIQLYRLWLEKTNSPIAYAVQFNLGVLLENSGDDASAITAYRSAIMHNPGFSEASFNLGSLLERIGRSVEAIAIWRALLAAVDQQPPSISLGIRCNAANHLWRLLEAQGELADAQDMLELSLRLDPQQANLIGHWISLRQRACLWPVYSLNAGLELQAMAEGTSPLSMLSLTDDPALQLESARRQVAQTVRQDMGHHMSSRQSYGHGHLRIGYLLSPTCLHAASTQLYVLHDRSQFEVFGFCWGLEENAMPQHARLMAGLDYCIKIDAVSDQEAARQIRFHEIDILIDQHGLEAGARPNILSHRPAPVQVAWPGFPGTTAHPEVDHVICDPFVLPSELEPFFTENPLRLPHTFRPGRQQSTNNSPSAKPDYGLPEKAFVYRVPGDPAKYTPEVTQAWLRILQRVPESVLWLAIDNETARQNLCALAAQSGLATSRLCFDTRGASTEDPTALQLADLFLDTFPFCSAMEANEALGAGLPVLTCIGRSFASRMTGSLLSALDLNHLIAHDLSTYEDMAVTLGQERTQTSELKRRLAGDRQHQPLFDNHRFVRELEALCQKVVNDLPTAPPKPRLTAADLAYIQAPYSATHSRRSEQPTTDRRYVIVTPPFSHNSAGIRVLYDLQKWLVLAGLDAIVCTWFPGYPVEQFADDIAIYPEVAPGNLLNAKRVIRYILNEPGKLGYGEKQYDKDEILVAYNKELAPYSNGVILQVPSIEPFFHAHGAVKTKSAVFVGKGKDLGKHPADCVAITKNFPATRREVAELLRSVKTLYMYDDFSMIGREAELCGCTVKLIQKNGAIVDYPRHNFPTLEEFKMQLHEFIEMTQRL